ncbi:macrolide 2'-phosphotransferase [Paenibacillus spongiae]|uniref:Macrolide 2'-phosphotransferase n=1 Tax=Paenibacillus spongiae TaxID=2909671 RepID=A0ABY5S6E9_9BACL|nr:macrolide 2'-phosphotransferase [Paenibacillus spongiae]UVI29234.1 macrolide 2'-phosphotransferase [Paenibacillus spongiae]
MEKNEDHVATVLELALKYGLSLNPDSVLINESGLDFLACFAEDEGGTPWVLRLPRRDDVVESASYERRVLSLVKPRLPVAVPDWKIHTAELIAYPRLKGIPAATIDPEARQYVWEIDEKNLPEAFVDTMATTLAALHTVGTDEATSEGIRILTSTEARTDFREKMEWVKRNYDVSDSLWTRWQRWMADDSYWPTFTTVVHGDIHPGHLLIGDHGHVTGLIDWTEGEVSDPSIDFQIYYALFGANGLSELIDRYERKGGRVWARMAEHIAERYAAYPVLIALFAEKTNSDEYRQYAQYMLGIQG